MQMTTEEIIRSYTTAKDKSKQIGILADLNGCDKEKIRGILISKGCQMPTKGRPRKEQTEPKGKARKVTYHKELGVLSTEEIKTEVEDIVKKDEFESPLRPIRAVIQKGGVVEVTLRNIDTGEEVTVSTEERLDSKPDMAYEEKPTLPDIVKNMIKGRLRDIEDEMIKLRLDKEELEDFLGQFADDV